MLHTRGSKFINKLFKRGMIEGTVERYQLPHKLLSAAIIYVVRRLLNVESSGSQSIEMADEKVPNDVRKLGFEMCRDSIGGIWSEIDQEQFEITHLSGGLTNYLYVCSLPPEVEVPDNQPRSVLFRVYGSIATSSSFLVQNSVIFAIMSEKKLGPKLYGMNTKARLEEYVQAKTLCTTDLHNPTLSRLIAKKLALFHSLHMPICKEPRFLFDTMDQWMVKVNNILRTKHPAHVEEFMTQFRSYNLAEELEALKRLLLSVSSPVVFCHNDLQEGNILHHTEHSTDPDNRLVVIDWEYCSYNYRGYDFGNHFVEWCYDYHVSEHPYYSANLDNYPSRAQQEEFFSSYLHASGEEVTSEKLQQMYIEANTFVLASHFLWGLWSILQNEMSTIQFGFLEYGVCRFEGYFTMKDQLCEKGIHINP